MSGININLILNLRNFIQCFWKAALRPKPYTNKLNWIINVHIFPLANHVAVVHSIILLRYGLDRMVRKAKKHLVTCCSSGGKANQQTVTPLYNRNKKKSKSEFTPNLEVNISLSTSRFFPFRLDLKLYKLNWLLTQADFCRSLRND